MDSTGLTDSSQQINNRIVIAQISKNKLFELQNLFSNNNSNFSEKNCDKEKNDVIIKKNHSYRLNSNTDSRTRGSRDRIVPSEFSSQKVIKTDENLIQNNFYDNNEEIVIKDMKLSDNLLVNKNNLYTEKIKKQPLQPNYLISYKDKQTNNFFKPSIVPLQKNSDQKLNELKFIFHKAKSKSETNLLAISNRNKEILKPMPKFHNVFTSDEATRQLLLNSKIFSKERLANVDEERKFNMKYA